jgi:hypothetical protein
MQNRVFFPQTALDVWLTDGAVDLTGDELTILSEGLAEGRRYRLIEAVRIVNEVTGTEDGNALLGKVKSKELLAEKKAELLESSLLLGDNAYDVVPGWLGEPIGSFDEHATQKKSSADGEGEPQSEEDLLASFLLKTM